MTPDFGAATGLGMRSLQEFLQNFFAGLGDAARAQGENQVALRRTFGYHGDSRIHRARILGSAMAELAHALDQGLRRNALDRFFRSGVNIQHNHAIRLMESAGEDELFSGNSTTYCCQHLDPAAACPPLKSDPQIAALVAEKQAKDDAKIAELAASGIKPIRLVYQDGGQHPAFAGRVAEVSRPEALAPPTEIVLEDRAPAAKGKAASRLAAAKTPATKIAAQQPNGGTGETAVAPNGKGPAPEETIKVSALANVPEPEGKRSISGWLGLHKEPEAAPAPAAAETPVAAEPANTGSKSTAKTSFDKAALGDRRPL